MGNAASILGDVSKTAHEILKHFPIRRVGSVEPSPFPQLVTGRICGLVHYMVAPVNNKPCVSLKQQDLYLKKISATYLGNTVWCFVRANKSIFPAVTTKYSLLVPNVSIK